MKKSLWILGIIIVLVLGWWYVSVNKVETPSEEPTVDLGNNTTTEVQGDLEGLNIDDLESEFQAIDSELDNL